MTPEDRTAAQVDLTNCEREQIQYLNHVQSFGCLIAVSADWIVTHASTNVTDILGLDPGAIIGDSLVTVLDHDAVHRLRTKMQTLARDNSSARVFGLDVMGDGRAFDVSLHITGDAFALEFEPKAQARLGDDDLSLIQPLIARVRRSGTFDGAVKEATRALKAILGIDRVMLYRFGADHSGSVIAEAKEHSMEAYLGLRYPASDIPAQARALYKRSLLRLIADVDAPTFPVVPERGPTGQPLDLSLATTRAVSTIHLEYLRNMGVGASLSVSILRKGELWGLFACHHRGPFHVDYEKRTAVELFAQLFSYELAQLETDAEFDAAERAREVHASLVGQISSGNDMFRNFEPLADRIGEVIAFDGIALYSDGQYVATGAAPTEEEFEPVRRFLNTTTAGQIYVTEALGDHMPSADLIADRVAGALAIPISRTPRDYLVAFRRGQSQTVTWAGNPEKPVTVGANGVRLTPRKSFEAWKQVVEGRSLPWTPAERRTAEALRVTLLEVVLRLTDEANAGRKRAQEQQELLIAELNHRVRNILNLIQGLIAQGPSDAASIADYRDVLDARVHSLARAHDQLTQKSWEWASLTDLIRVEVTAFVNAKSARVEITGDDIDLSPQAFTTFALVVHELVTNSAKYGGLSDTSGRVEVVTTLRDDGSLHVSWKERGGPPVHAPNRRGFGTTIIEKSVPFELKGTASLSYKLTGVEAEFTVPAKHVRRSAGRTAKEVAAKVAAGGAVRLSGSALVVEDNMIIAMDSADLMAELGADNVFTASDTQTALRFLDQHPITVALLDVNLGSETSLVVAEACAERGIPFVLATGYGESGEIVNSYPAAQVLKKPFRREHLVAALSTIDKLRPA